MSMTHVIVAVSGGRTSSYMAYWMKQNPDVIAERIGVTPEFVQYHYVFANTGMEHNDTLRFMRDVDEHFNLGVVWLEGVPHLGVRKSTSHRIVSFDTAYRNTQFNDPKHPFHAHITKYGIPNVKMLSCTREMKLNTMNSYTRSLDLIPRKCYVSIGIRDDEKRRVAKNSVEQKILYPLIDWNPVDKQDVLDFWSAYDWDLSIPEWQGNCITCYKKSYKKLMKVWQETPEAFDFNRFMEQRYAEIGPEFTKYDNAVPRTFFRMNNTADSLIASFENADSPDQYINVMDDAGCSESCEMFEMENDDAIEQFGKHHA